MNTGQLHLYGTGFALKIEDMEFDPAKDYRACLICGDIFQSQLDRMEFKTPDLIVDAKTSRDRWARLHARRHTNREHHTLALSEGSMLPEAANKLAAFGLLPIMDMVDNDEVIVALFESNAMPKDDSES